WPVRDPAQRARTGADRMVATPLESGRGKQDLPGRRRTRQRCGNGRRVSGGVGHGRRGGDRGAETTAGGFDPVQRRFEAFVGAVVGDEYLPICVKYRATANGV